MSTERRDKQGVLARGLRVLVSSVAFPALGGLALAGVLGGVCWVGSWLLAGWVPSWSVGLADFAFSSQSLLVSWGLALLVMAGAAVDRLCRGAGVGRSRGPAWLVLGMAGALFVAVTWTAWSWQQARLNEVVASYEATWSESVSALAPPARDRYQALADRMKAAGEWNPWWASWRMVRLSAAVETSAEHAATARRLHGELEHEWGLTRERWYGPLTGQDAEAVRSLWSKADEAQALGQHAGAERGYREALGLLRRTWPLALTSVGPEDRMALALDLARATQPGPARAVAYARLLRQLWQAEVFSEPTSQAELEAARVLTPPRFRAWRTDVLHRLAEQRFTGGELVSGLRVAAWLGDGWRMESWYTRFLEPWVEARMVQGRVEEAERLFRVVDDPGAWYLYRRQRLRSAQAGEDASRYQASLRAAEQALLPPMPLAHAADAQPEANADAGVESKSDPDLDSEAVYDLLEQSLRDWPLRRYLRRISEAVPPDYGLIRLHGPQPLPGSLPHRLELARRHASLGQHEIARRLFRESVAEAALIVSPSWAPAGGGRDGHLPSVRRVYEADLPTQSRRVAVLAALAVAGKRLGFDELAEACLGQAAAQHWGSWWGLPDEPPVTLPGVEDHLVASPHRWLSWLSGNLYLTMVSRQIQADRIDTALRERQALLHEKLAPSNDTDRQQFDTYLLAFSRWKCRAGDAEAAGNTLQEVSDPRRRARGRLEIAWRLMVDGALAPARTLLAQLNSSEGLWDHLPWGVGGDGNQMSTQPPELALAQGLGAAWAQHGNLSELPAYWETLRDERLVSHFTAGAIRGLSAQGRGADALRIRSAIDLRLDTLPPRRAAQLRSLIQDAQAGRLPPVEDPDTVVSAAQSVSQSPVASSLDLDESLNVQTLRAEQRGRAAMEERGPQGVVQAMIAAGEQELPHLTRLGLLLGAMKARRDWLAGQSGQAESAASP